MHQLRLALALLSLMAVLPLTANAEENLAPCQAKIDALKAQGLSQENLGSVSFYVSSTPTYAKRYVVIAEQGDYTETDGVSHGWLKVLDLQTQKVKAYPMKGPGMINGLGAFMAQKSGNVLKPISDSLKGVSRTIDSCSLSPAQSNVRYGDKSEKKDSFCLFPNDYEELKAILAEEPMVVALPGTSSTQGKDGKQILKFSKDVPENKSGLNHARLKSNDLAKVAYGQSTSICKLLNSTSASSAPSSNDPGASPGTSQ